MLGYVDEATKVQAIDSAVAIVNPSIADNVEVYSIILSELGLGKNQIGSNIGEVSYRITQNINGLLVEPSKPEQLGKAMGS